jgi:hypothetical protein
MRLATHKDLLPKGGALSIRKALDLLPKAASRAKPRAKPKPEADKSPAAPQAEPEPEADKSPIGATNDPMEAPSVYRRKLLQSFRDLQKNDQATKLKYEVEQLIKDLREMKLIT